MFHGSSHVYLTKSLGLQVLKGLVQELVRIYIAYVLASSQTFAHSIQQHAIEAGYDCFER